MQPSKITPRQVSTTDEAGTPSTDGGTSPATTTSIDIVTSAAASTQVSQTESTTATSLALTDSSSPSPSPSSLHSLNPTQIPTSVSTSISASQLQSTTGASGSTTIVSQTSSTSNAFVTFTSPSLTVLSSLSTASSAPTSSASASTPLTSTSKRTSTSVTGTSSSTSETSNAITSSSSRQLTTVTSSIVTTINGQATTVATVFPTALNSPASIGSTPGSHTGVVAGAAIAGSLLFLLLLTGVFFVYRRRVRRKAAFSHRSLPAPRSGLLADDDAFDLAGGPSLQQMYSVPPLMPIRGAETGSLFHEGVWPPPGERSRLEDPILAGSNVDLTSIVDSIMGAEGDSHARWSSADTGGSSTPLLGYPADRSAGSGKAATTFNTKLELALRETSETMPLNPSGHAHQANLDGSSGSSPSTYMPLPPGAAVPVVPSSWNSARSTQITGTGTLPPFEARFNSSGVGPLMVINNTPDAEVQQPLVDLTLGQEEPPSEIPPLYHMIRRNTDASWRTPLQPTAAQVEPVAEESTKRQRLGRG